MEAMSMARCYVCGDSLLDDDEIVWVDPDTLEATTGDGGEPFCIECAPAEYGQEED